MNNISATLSTWESVATSPSKSAGGVENQLNSYHSHHRVHGCNAGTATPALTYSALECCCSSRSSNTSSRDSTPRPVPNPHVGPGAPHAVSTLQVDEEIPDVASMRSQGPAREPLGVQCGRCMRFAGFCLVCTGTLFQALAPWMLSVIEVATLLLLLLLLLLPHHPPGPYEFSFSSSLEDLVALSGLRAAAICGTYAYGSKRYQLRAYLYTSYMVGSAGFVYALVKAYVFMYPLVWLPSAGMLLTFAVFSWLHILAARHTVTWARRQGVLGLAPFNPLGGMRYSGSAGSLTGSAAPGWLEDSEADVPPEFLADPDSRFVDVDGIVVHYKEALPEQAFTNQWLNVYQPLHGLYGQQQQQLGRLQQGWQQGQQYSMSAVADGPSSSSQAAAGTGALSSVSEEVGVCSSPAAAPAVLAGDDAALVLVHGFGGGVFAWRHVLEPLAATVGARVVAFDRPGFGLTSRPDAADISSSGSSNSQQQQQQASPHSRRLGGSQAATLQYQQALLPGHHHHQRQQQQHEAYNHYTIEAQACLTLRFCKALGLKKVVLVGHADGCLVVVHAAAAACKAAVHHHRHHQPQQGQAGSSDSSVHPSHLDIPLQPAGSVDLSWMGSLGEDPTPRMIARAAQAVLQQQAGGSPGSVTSPGQPGNSSLDSSTVTSPAPAGQQPAATAGAPVSPFAAAAAAPNPELLSGQQQQALMTNRLLEDVRAAGECEQADASSPASSISFQSLLCLEGTVSDTGAAGSGSGSVSAGASTGELTSAGVSQLQQHTCQAGSAAVPDKADSLQSSGSFVLKPPQPQVPMSSSQWRDMAAAAEAGHAGLPPLPNGHSSRISRLGRGSGSSSGGDGGFGGCSGVQVCGLVLLHPNLSGHQVPPFTRLLAGSSLGRSMLRPLLRSEVGEVTNRRAWHNPDLITREVLALYKRPLHVQGWDAALLASSRATGTISHRRVAAQFAVVRQLPSLLVTGEHDRIATPAKVSAVAALLLRAQRAVVPACGHLSHEEAPQKLLELLVPFCRERLVLGRGGP